MTFRTFGRTSKSAESMQRDDFCSNLEVLPICYKVGRREGEHMTLEARLRKVEAAAQPGECRCADCLRIHWHNYREAWGKDAPEPGAEYCPVCGGRRIDVAVEYVSDWR